MRNIREGFYYRLIIIFGFFVFGSLSFWGAGVAQAGDLEERIAACAGMADADARLKCFDEAAASATAPEKTVLEDAPVLSSIDEKKELSVLTRHWDLDPTYRRNSFILRPYRMNYFLAVAYNSSPNDEVGLEYDSNAKSQFNEAKFQLSFKAKVWEDVLQKPLQGFYDKVGFVQGVDVWMAYTQMSFWQLYNSAFSSPFRDTNYEPEAIINFRSRLVIPGFGGTRLQFFNVGFNHQSNGRSRPLSRSWNRIIGGVGLEKDNFNVQLKTWYRLPEDAAVDDNPDLIRFMGYGELLATFFWEKQRFAVMLRNNFRQDNLGAVQLDWSMPPITLGKLLFGSFVSEATLNKYLTDKFSLYVQYFNGYGEGLMDYNKSMNRISAGIMLAEWN